MAPSHSNHANKSVKEKSIGTIPIHYNFSQNVLYHEIFKNDQARTTKNAAGKINRDQRSSSIARSW